MTPGPSNELSVEREPEVLTSPAEGTTMPPQNGTADLGSPHGVTSPSTPSSTKARGGGWRSMFGGKGKEEDSFQVDHPIDVEYYERTGTPFPKYYSRCIDHWGRKRGPEMYKACLKWRATRDIDNMVLKPYPNYWIIKENSPHFVFGQSKAGSWVSYELNGKVEPAKMAKTGLKAEDIEYHVAWSNEFVRYAFDDGEEGHFMTVMDMKGFSILKASNWFFLMLTKTYGDTLYKYYPNALERLVIVNPPMGTATIYKIMMSVLPGVFGDKTIIASDPSELLQWIDADQLPVQYGGQNATPLNESMIEKQIRAHLDAVNSGKPPLPPARTGAFKLHS